MSVITVRVSDDEYALISSYVKANQLNMSSFARSSMLDKVEEDLSLDEKRILAAKKRAEIQKHYSADEVWQELGI